MSAQNNIAPNHNTALADLPNPNISQQEASNPEASVWVNASAGTGKTKVLTDRVLRLLLPDANGNRKSSLATRILCITFTKAAASEMATRVNKILAEWAVLPDDKLYTALEDLLAQPPSERQITTARRLFSDVIDAPGGLKIMTIHAFCQSVLGRFPLEANIPPNFSVIDEAEALKLVTNARRRVLAPERLNTNPEISALMGRLAAEKNEDQVTEVIMNVLSERMQLRRVLEKFEEKEAFFNALCDDIKCPKSIEATDILASLDMAALWEHARIMQTTGGKKEVERGASLQAWLEKDAADQLSSFSDLPQVFLTASKGTPYSLTKGFIKENPAVESQIEEYLEAITAIDQQLKNHNSAALTADLIFLGQYVLEDYKREKELLGVLDYEDLIFKTHALLKGEDTARWVLFKLDGGLDHLLIDEAQDTNPEQWEIIDTLCTEFFAGFSARDEINRTIFTVGDEKQSIYSFQRADPDAYQDMRHHFRAQIDQAEKLWSDVDMTVSFRSTKTILDLVDATFESPALRQTLGPSYNSEALKHHSFREGHAGHAEIWPIIEPEADKDKEKPQGWQLPLEIKRQNLPETQLADQMAREIRGWLREGRLLPSKGRKIHEGDIMVLVKSRSKIVGELLRAFKKYGLAVAGVDRIVLSKNIAIMDLLALAQISILPEDDLSLACILKSPFIGMSEDQLFDLCHGRKGSLWQTLKQHKSYSEAAEWIKKLARIAHKERPYEFFNMALNTACPQGDTGYGALINRLGGDIDEALSEFLNLSIHYEQDNLPSVQGFLNWFSTRDATVKRQMEEAGREIRIMTVHGSKGLQAPIVFLPDTLQGRDGVREDNNLLWPNQTGYKFPLYSPRSADQPDRFKSAKTQIKEKQQAEYNRLLYVAMTRAEDELYICASGKAPKSHRNSWYHLIEDGITHLAALENPDGRRIINEPQSAPLKEQLSQAAPLNAPNMASAPQWMFNPPAQEPTPTRPLSPSRPDEDEPAVNSPRDADNSYRFLRGNITHKLLEILPSLPTEYWTQAATRFVEDSGKQLSDKIRAEIISETLHVLNHPEFSAVFGEGSMAEVPITGKLKDNVVISAQIDRMVVTDDEILIVDFKTNRPSPQDAKDIPAIYRKQLKLYAEVIAKIYPSHKIRTALLWTDRADLMEIEHTA